MRIDKEIAKDVEILFSKGYTHDYGDTDYFYDATDEELDRAYEMLGELQEYGRKAFVEKYGL